MIRCFTLDGRHLVPAPRLRHDSIWIDLVAPDADESAEVADLVGLRVPSRADMEEIEVSSRLYSAGGAAYMTAILPAQSEDGDPEMAPVSFVLAEDRLVTVRHHAPRAFDTFPGPEGRLLPDPADATAVLIGLLEAVVDRLADILETAAGDIDAISRAVFRPGDATERDFQAMLERIGRKGDLTSNIRDSLVTLDRLARYLGQMTARGRTEKELRDRVKVLGRDVASLLDHAGFLAQKITFLLDATLGMISIEQNAIIKIFSVVAVMFLPPTLIASIYGMNFRLMPELGWPFGYPLALALMAVSAVVPYFYFKRRGWL
ncbi:Magnesium transport protein CorA [Roseivivax jejudonensis]|uniref:Magnesium transport protein CorA n=1 Tax=Roseivivax jejudonensis TaxID=1529041 RepID=A0A1X6ZGS6_9RHOB|nr:magnesium transporter CorA family protein [Roseivivax jejudonensis]SLN50589.1 Magnesium transport protein CorA [Roseivivax jejudonensis]